MKLNTLLEKALTRLKGRPFTVDIRIPAHVLFLHSSDDLYGSDLILLQIVQGLDRERFVPLVVLPEDMQHVGLLSKELQLAGIEYVHLPIAIVRRRYLRPRGLVTLAANVLRGTWRLWRLVREREVRLIHGFTLAVLAAPILALVTSLPLVMHAHEILQRPRLLRRVLHFLGVRRSSQVICISEAVRQNILEDEPKAAGRLEVVHNGLAMPPATGRSRSEMRRELGVPADRPLIGMIGRVSPWKGQLTFLEAAAIVREAHPEAYFIAIGGVFDGEMQHHDRMMELWSRLQLEETVTIAGFRKDARELMSSFDMFVLPSTSPEPFGMVILEAMAAGLPVIATACGGPGEIVVQGETGLLVAAGDPSALAAAVASLLEDASLRERMGAAGRSRVLRSFALARYLEHVQQIYSGILRM